MFGAICKNRKTTTFAFVNVSVIWDVGFSWMESYTPHRPPLGNKHRPRCELHDSIVLSYKTKLK